MSTLINDFPNTTLKKQLIAPQLLTATTTNGTGADMLLGDGNLFATMSLGTWSGTAITLQLQQSTLTNSGFANISGASVSAVTNTTPILTVGPFQRDQRYVRAILTVSGTTIGVSSDLYEMLKTI